MAKKYHIKNSGDPGICKAVKGNCPFGDEELHYSSPAEARKAFEEIMTPVHYSRKISLKHLDSDGLRKALYSEAHEKGMDVIAIRHAAVLASELHEGQYRAAAPGEKRPPYITHPLRNAVRVIRWGAQNTDTVIATLLHDVVEDSALKYTEIHGISVKSEEEARRILLKKISQDYNSYVASLVNGLSNPIVPDHVKKNLSLEEKHEIYKTHVAEAIASNRDVFLIKLSDLHDNAAGIHHTDFEGRKEQTLRQAKKYLNVIPVLKEEIEKFPFESETVHRSVDNSIAIIEARLLWMLSR